MAYVSSNMELCYKLIHGSLWCSRLFRRDEGLSIFLPKVSWQFYTNTWAFFSSAELRMESTVTKGNNVHNTLYKTTKKYYI